jgi:hypothetical protein
MTHISFAAVADSNAPVSLNAASALDPSPLSREQRDPLKSVERCALLCRWLA